MNRFLVSRVCRKSDIALYYTTRQGLDNKLWYLTAHFRHPLLCDEAARPTRDVYVSGNNRDEGGLLLQTHLSSMEISPKFILQEANTWYSISSWQGAFFYELGITYVTSFGVYVKRDKGSFCSAIRYLKFVSSKDIVPVRLEIIQLDARQSLLATWNKK